MSDLFKQGHACVIGVGGDLPSTVTDAKGLVKVLKDPERCAYPESQVHLLTGEEATRSQILQTLETMANSADDDSTVLIYFSGHGHQLQKPFKSYFLMPYGYNTEALDETAISGSEFVEYLREIPAQKLLVMLDCCHAGGLSDVSAFEATKAPLPPEAQRMFAKGGGRIMIGSSRPDELSYAGEPYSAFTYALIKGLCGEGATQQDGYIRATDLAMYASRIVPNLTRDKQHPVLDIEKADNFVLAYYAGGDLQPKGLPPELALEPRIESRPGELNGQMIQTTITASGDGAVAVQNAQGATIVTGRDNIVGDNNSVVIHQGNDPWAPVGRREEARHNVIERFWELHEQQRIWVAESERETFDTALETGKVLLIRGLPGSGKTTVGLELASRYYQKPQIYYATFQDNLEVDGLWKTAHRHCQVPSLFVLDDCHLNLQAAQIFRERLSPELRNGQAKILLLGRDVDLSGEDAEECELIEELREDGLVIDFKQEVNRTKEFIEFLRPDFLGLSQTRLERLQYSTGGDFLLLDEVLQDKEITPPDIDRFTPSQICKSLYKRLDRHYFKNKSSLQIVRRLASLAQFDLLPLSRVFADSWNRDQIAQGFPGLIGEVMGPPRYRFLHSSLSELIFNALIERDIPKDLPEAERQSKALEETQQELISYFQKLLEEVHLRNYSSTSLLQDLRLVLFGQLKLSSSMAELKAGGL